MTARRLLLASVLLATPPALARPMVPQDVVALVDVADPQVSPDGATVAYVARTANLAADKPESHIWLVPYAGGAPRQLTGQAGQSETNPLFSPDGKFLYFLSARGDAHDAAQLWRLPLAGGEAERLSDFPGGVTDLAVRPDGAALALVVADPDPTAGQPHPTPLVIDRFAFKHDEDGYLTARRNRLFLFDPATRHADRLTTGEFDEALPQFAPDGKTLAFVSKRDGDPDRTSVWRVHIVPAKPGAAPEAISPPDLSAADPDWETRPVFAPDGNAVAYPQGGLPIFLEYASHQPTVHRLQAHLTFYPAPELNRNVGQLVWTQDGAALLFLVENDGARELWRFRWRDQSLARLDTGRNAFLALAERHGHVAALVSTPDRPAELFAVEEGVLRRLTHHNDKLLSELTLAPVRETSFHSADGTEVHGFLTVPPTTPPFAPATQPAPGNPPPAKPAPLPAVLRIHGGPQLQYSVAFNPEWQVLAGHGYAVIAANPRGSTGRGLNYAWDIKADWGNKDAKDVLAAVDDAVKSGIADPNRLGIGGWSYGGMLTNYVIAQDGRFRAATSGASISNILAGYGTDQYVRDYEIELGPPWKNQQTWEHISFPFLHADRIHTPTLFLGGDHDFNVPLQNQEQMYQALRSLNVPTELVIYPGATHRITRPSFIIDRLTRYLAWYDKYLK